MSLGAEESELRASEQLTPEQNLGHDMHKTLRTWIKGPWKDKFITATRQLSSGGKELGRTQATVRTHVVLGAQLARALTKMDQMRSEAGEELARTMANQLQQDLFGPKSVRSSMEGVSTITGGDTLRGPISQLTLVDLIRKSSPIPESRLEMSQLIPPAGVDMDSKIDLKFDFGDRDIYDRKIIRAVQLKSSSRNKVSVTPVLEDSGHGLAHHMSEEDIGRMYAYKASYEKNHPDCVLQIFQIEVPGYDAVSDNWRDWDPYGRIFDDSIIRQFQEEALVNGFLPSQQ